MAKRGSVTVFNYLISPSFGNKKRGEANCRHRVDQRVIIASWHVEYTAQEVPFMNSAKNFEGGPSLSARWHGQPPIFCWRSWISKTFICRYQILPPEVGSRKPVWSEKPLFWNRSPDLESETELIPNLPKKNIKTIFFIEKFVHLQLQYSKRKGPKTEKEVRVRLPRQVLKPNWSAGDYNGPLD